MSRNLSAHTLPSSKCVESKFHVRTRLFPDLCIDTFGFVQTNGPNVSVTCLNKFQNRFTNSNLTLVKFATTADFVEKPIWPAGVRTFLCKSFGIRLNRSSRFFANWIIRISVFKFFH